MKQGITLVKLLQWAYDHKLDIELTRYAEGLNVKNKGLQLLVIRNGPNAISHIFNSLNDTEEIEYFAKQAAIKLLIKDLEL